MKLNIEEFTDWQNSFNDKITDNVIIKYFKFNKCLLYLNNKFKIYLENRFPDSYSLKETLYRIKNHIEEKPKCPICGKPVHYIGKKNRQFRKYCSCKCASNDIEVQRKRQETDKKKHNGILAWTLSNKNKDKIKNRKETFKTKYNSLNVYKIPEIKKKIIQSNLSRYGVDNPMKNKEVYQKYWKSIKKNKKEKISKEEKIVYNQLKKYFSIIKTQYSDKRYPFHCDFYIPLLDLFIEYQGSQFHHKHAFNPLNNDDLIELERLKYKAGIKHKEGKIKSQYDKIIETWSIKDILKRNMALKNHLNFIEIWNINDVDKQILNFLGHISLEHENLHA